MADHSSIDGENEVRVSDRLRPRIKWLLIIVASIVQLARILNVQSTTGETPFLSANDRSRWCTILALTVNGNYVIDDVIEIRDESPPNRRTWYTIDMVQHRGADGKQHFYSSKPPLLPTLQAGVYWVVRAVTGATLTTDPFWVARIMLIIVNLIPLMVLWWLFIQWADRLCPSAWQFVALSVFAVGGTFLSTFSVTLNNHLPAAVSAAISFWALEKILLNGDRSSKWFALAGLATSFTAANELPAASWVAIVGLLLALTSPRKALMVYAPALLPVTIAFFATNYIAHGTWRPAYSQRAVGAKIDKLETALPVDIGQLDTKPLIALLDSHGIELSDSVALRKGRREGVWELWDESSQWRIALRVDAANQLGVYHWGDWYDYPNSYWVEGRKKGVDRGEPDPLKYAFHCLIGHHGILSLTPFWIFALLGALRLWYRPNHTVQPYRWLNDSERMILVALCTTTIIVIGFYLSRPLEDRNYGGVCCGLRWSFWLIPFWFWLSGHGLASIKSVAGKAVVVIALSFSIFSATYPWSNPWTSPWCYQETTQE